MLRLAWPAGARDRELEEQADKEIIRAEANTILASGVLGRSRFYAALLEYLVECGERVHTPKEVEIAAEVFNRRDAFDPSQDSLVRVYAHKLRQKLEQYYADLGDRATRRIGLPKGEYRVVLEDSGAVEPVALPASRPRFGRPVGVALLLVAGLAVGIMLDRAISTEPDAALRALHQVAESPLWAPLADDDLPVTIVVGDYYIFGELDSIGNIDRLVREFEINSSRDLDERFMIDPDSADRYIDLDLTYLPSSTAFAMRDLMAVLTAAGKDVRVVAISGLDTTDIRETHIVYIGFLSGLGMLTDFVFSGSELIVGDTFDELVNRETGDAFISEAGLPSGMRSYRDYGLFSTLPGPGGNQLVFIAGTRDEGLMETAAAVTDASLIQASIDAVSDENGDTPDAYELLYEVAGLDRTNLDATIVHAAPLASAQISIGRLAP